MFIYVLDQIFDVLCNGGYYMAECWKFCIPVIILYGTSYSYRRSMEEVILNDIIHIRYS